MSEVISSPRLNLGAAVLAVVSSKNGSGAFTDEITQSLLKLRERFNLEPIATRPGPTGFDSDRVRSLIGVFVVRGFLKEDSPARTTEKGEKWMNAELTKYFADNEKLKQFLKCVSETAK